jgi:hypothetical protein
VEFRISYKFNPSEFADGMNVNLEKARHVRTLEMEDVVIKDVT